MCLNVVNHSVLIIILLDRKINNQYDSNRTNDLYFDLFLNCKFPNEQLQTVLVHIEANQFITIIIWTLISMLWSALKLTNLSMVGVYLMIKS